MDVKEKLINAVKIEESLYVKKHIGYRNRATKRQAWERVAVRVGMSADWCEKKWALLRQRYSREKRMESYEGSDDGYEKSHWEYMDIMNFLNEYVEPRNPIRNSSVKDVLNTSMNDQKINIKNMFETSTFDSIVYEATIDDVAEEYTTMEEDARAAEEAIMEDDPVEAEDVVVEEDATVDLEISHASTMEPSRSNRNVDREICEAIAGLNGIVKKLADQQVNPEERFMLTAADLLKGLPERELTLVKQKIMSIIFESRERNNI